MESVTAPMFLPWTVTARDSGLRREPWQAGQLPDQFVGRGVAVPGLRRSLGPVHQRICAGRGDVGDLFGQDFARPIGAAENDRGVGGPLVARESRTDAGFDLMDLMAGVGQFVDAVDENDDIARLQVRDQPDQPEVGRGQRLLGRQHDHADAAVTDGSDGHLFAHQERVVHPRRVANAQLAGQVAAMQIQIGRAGDIGEPALFAGIFRFAVT